VLSLLLDLLPLLLRVQLAKVQAHPQLIARRPQV
jgi:hypothetical protein